MFNRIKQVVAALTARVTPEDKVFVSRYLNAAEQKLFYGMNLPDQRHVLNVAQTALQLAKFQQKIDINLLVKCALLHDVGKVKNDVSTLDKIITVLGHKLSPQWARQWGRSGRGSKFDNVRHAFYIYFNHGARSAAMLAAINSTPGLVNIVAKHHEAPADDDPLELIILRKADNQH